MSSLRTDITKQSGVLEAAAAPIQSLYDWVRDIFRASDEMIGQCIERATVAATGPLYNSSGLGNLNYNGRPSHSQIRQAEFVRIHHEYFVPSNQHCGHCRAWKLILIKSEQTMVVDGTQKIFKWPPAGNYWLKLWNYSYNSTYRCCNCWWWAFTKAWKCRLHRHLDVIMVCSHYSLTVFQIIVVSYLLNAWRWLVSRGEGACNLATDH